jgi:hypothetical protein
LRCQQQSPPNQKSKGVYDHRTSELGLKADAIAQFIYSAEVQAIGIVEANGMVSLHGLDATHREERLPLIASDQDFAP